MVRMCFQVFALINLLIERCGEALKPLVMQLAGALPQLWEQAEGQSLLRIQARRARSAAHNNTHFFIRACMHACTTRVCATGRGRGRRGPLR